MSPPQPSHTSMIPHFSGVQPCKCGFGEQPSPSPHSDPHFLHPLEITLFAVMVVLLEDELEEGGRKRKIRCNFVRFESCVQAAAVCSDVAAVVRRRFMSFVLTAAAAGSLLRCVQCWLQSTYFWYLEWRVERGEMSVEKQSRKVQKNGLGDASVMCRHQVILVALGNHIENQNFKMKIY